MTKWEYVTVPVLIHATKQILDNWAHRRNDGHSASLKVVYNMETHEGQETNTLNKCSLNF